MCDISQLWEKINVWVECVLIRVCSLMCCNQLFGNLAIVGSRKLQFLCFFIFIELNIRTLKLQGEPLLCSRLYGYISTYSNKGIDGTSWHQCFWLSKTDDFFPSFIERTGIWKQVPWLCLKLRLTKGHLANVDKNGRRGAVIYQHWRARSISEEIWKY